MGNKLEKLRKIKDRMRDELFIFKHAHLVKAMIESTEDDLVNKEECDEHSISIAFRPMDLETISLVLSFWMNFWN